MKKITFLCILLAISFGYAQNAPIDFEAGGNGDLWNWTVFDNDDDPPLEIIANPVPGGINTSATVAKFSKRAAGGNYAGFESQHGSDLGSFAVTTGNSIVKMMVYQVGTPSNIAIKLTTPGEASPPEVVASNTIADAWVELEFDLSVWIGLILPGGNPDQIEIFSYYLTSTPDRVTYFDNIRFVPPPCPTTTTWTVAGAWNNGTPTIGVNAVIDGAYTTNATNGSFSACSLTVNGTLTIDNGYFIEVGNDVTVNGDLIVETQGNFIQNNESSYFFDNSTNGVLITKTKAMQNEYSYTYWSSPVVGETIEQVFSTTPADRRYTFNAANFVDMFAEVGNTGIFNPTPGVDDIDDDGNDWINTPTGTLQTGIGYAITPSIFGPAFPRPENFVFRGAFNNGEVLVPIVNNSGGLYNDWNFIGNPYPSAINASQFFTVNSGIVDVIYLWDQATPVSNTSGGSQGYNFSTDDYAMINGSGGVGARGGVGSIPNGSIATGQGFFVEALIAGNVTFNNSMRANGTIDNSQFFKNSSSKKSSTLIANRLWVNLISDNGVFNQILVAYVDGATNNNDGTFYDAKRIPSTGNAAILYSTIEYDNSKFAIQGKAPESLSENEVINLGFRTNIEVATLYKLSIAQLEGEFLTSNTIYVKDNLLNILHDLSASDYTFTSEVGEFKDRFEIAFSANALSTDDIDAKSNTLKIIELTEDHVQFTASKAIKSVRIFDLLGRQLYNFKGQSNSETYKLSNLSSAIYIAKVELSNGAILTKKAFKK